MEAKKTLEKIKLPLNERIKFILDYSNLSQRKFAERTDLSQATVSFLVLGRTESPDKKTIESILRAFPEVSKTWLTLGIGEPFIDHFGSESADNLIKRIQAENESLKEQNAKLAAQVERLTILLGKAMGVDEMGKDNASGLPAVEQLYIGDCFGGVRATA